MPVLRYIVKDVFNSLGYEVHRVPRPSEVKIRHLDTDDPVTFQYMPRQRGATVFAIDIGDTRSLFSLGLRPEARTHPFVRAALAAMHSGTQDQAARSVREIVENYYDLVQPASALESVGLEAEDAPGLRGIPAASWIAPWSDKSIAETTRGRRLAVGLDALQYGKVLDFSQGITAFGPVGKGKLSLEVDRICGLVKSVENNGFWPFNRKNPMKVLALRRGDSYRWLTLAGHHRFAVCAAFSLASVSAIVTDIVRREDHHYWPQVVSGTFSPEGALAFFDRLFDGIPAAACATWIERNPLRQRSCATANGKADCRR